MDARAYLERVLYTRKEVDDWIAGTGTAYSREKYDAVAGWVPQAGTFKHGVDDCVCAYSYDPSGARRMVAYGDKPCRMNSYGNSFTHCDQVSDGETWQERLAAHLCEPVRNFGVSGHSVYQAYARMRREEDRTPAKYVILNIYSDDHYRNVYGWASLAVPRPKIEGRVLRRPTMPYVKVNPATGEFREFGNACPTPESLYNLCDLDWVYEHFKDDFRLQILLARENIKQKAPEKSYEEITDLARQQGLEAHINSEEALAATLDKMYTRAAVFSSMRIVEKVEEFAAVRGKKVLYVLSYTVSDVAKTLKEGRRFDQEFLDFLRDRKSFFVDDLEAHRADFAQFKTSVDEYLRRYYIGHYNPLGNLFQAFALKQKLVEMLEPKPLAYTDFSSISLPKAVSADEKVVNPGKIN